MSVVQITETLKDLNTYVAGIEARRKKRAEDLRVPDGWLSLTGLFELKEGEQTIGSNATSDAVLPASAPAHLGTLALHDKKVTLHLALSPAVETAVTVDGVSVLAGAQIALADNQDGAATPTLVRLGSVSFFVHKYGDHYAIRVKDSQNPAIQEFAGFTWFEVKPDYRVRGRFVPHSAPQKVEVNTTVNTIAKYQSPGVVEFELHGQPLSLLVTSRHGNKLSIILRDATSGKQTYPAVRFLTVEVDADNNVDVDFNMAYNPPCALTPYATCPLPPRENILPVAIEAGEQY